MRLKGKVAVITGAAKGVHSPVAIGRPSICMHLYGTRRDEQKA